MRKKIISLILVFAIISLIHYGSNHFLFGKDLNSKEIIKKINRMRKLADKKIEKIFKYVSYFETNVDKILSLLEEYKLIFNIELKYISQAKAKGIDLKNDFYEIERSTRKNIESLNILLNISPKETCASFKEALNLTQKGRVALINYYAELNNSNKKESLNLIDLREILKKGGD